jgi:Ca2+-binding EF-hand superfamily protein
MELMGVTAVIAPGKAKLSRFAGVKMLANRCHHFSPRSRAFFRSTIMRLQPILVGVIAVLLAGAPVLAQDRSELFAQLDTNQDGYVSLDEVPAEHRAKFERLLKLAGKEQEKKINKALFQGAVRAEKSGSNAAQADAKEEPRPRESEDLFAKLDMDKDGIVKAEEVAESQKAAFERLLKNGDIDGDGKLSREEYAASTKATETPRQPGRGGGAPGQARPGGPPIDPREMFARMDRNQDGKISKDEAPPRIQENFDRIDANSDGALSPEEFGRVAGAFGQRPPGAGGLPAPGMPPMGLFSILDTDRDGEISTAEIVGAGTALLKLDRNGDGKLTPDEVFAQPPRGSQRPPQP